MCEVAYCKPEVACSLTVASIMAHCAILVSTTQRSIITLLQSTMYLAEKIMRYILLYALYVARRSYMYATDFNDL